MIRLLLLICTFVAVAFAQFDGSRITVTGDRLEGMTVNGERIREVSGNVVLVQDSVVITCNKAIQYLDRNSARLIGDVVVRQDSMVIETQKGQYWGDQRLATADTTVELYDGELNLLADIGKYSFRNEVAEFIGNVLLFDSVNTLTSQRLIYFNETDKAIATEEVIIRDSVNTIYADSLIHDRPNRYTDAYHNVVVFSPDEGIRVYGDHLEQYSDSGYTLVDNSPFFFRLDSTQVIQAIDTVRMDTTFTTRIDTFMMRAEVMEFFRDSTDRFVATDSVRLLRREFASWNDQTIFLRAEDRIVIRQPDEEARMPALWFDTSELSGDSINIQLRDQEIEFLAVEGDGLLATFNAVNPLRVDQISGSRIQMNFAGRQLRNTEVEGDVLSIYYMYEDGEPSGLIKASARDAKIVFEEQEVSEVRLYGSPDKEFYPENMVEGAQKTYKLPGFRTFLLKPTEYELLLQFREFQVPLWLFQ